MRNRIGMFATITDLEKDKTVGDALRNGGNITVIGPRVQFNLNVDDNQIACACPLGPHWLWVPVEIWDGVSLRGWRWRVLCKPCAAKEDMSDDFLQIPLLKRFGWARYLLALLDEWALGSDPK